MYAFSFVPVDLKPLVTKRKANAKIGAHVAHNSSAKSAERQ